VSVAYDSEHAAVRRALLAVASPADPCWRCGRPLGPDPSRIDLGHRDDGQGWSGLEHRRCNRQAGARQGNARRRAARRRVMDTATAVALGIEVAEDRRHTSICAAGRLEGDLVLIELAAYLEGTASAVGRVTELCGRWPVVAVVVDPMGGATTLRRPLREVPGVKVVEPAAADVKVAHGEFLDLFAARRIRHARQAELTTAIQHLAERTLGGMPVFDRRGAPVDVSPAVAAELATWGLVNAPPKRTPFHLVGR
jgi:hypothetical protein